MSDIKFVQTSSNFGQFSKIKKLTSNNKLNSLTQKTKIGATILFPEGLENTPYFFNEKKHWKNNWKKETT